MHSFKLRNNSLNNPYNQLFWFFILFHLGFWTILPTIARLHLPMDSIEGALWGHEFQWGYDKNPYLSAWITALAVSFGNYHDGIIYLTSQLAITFCFIGTWLLAKRLVTPLLAFLSVILLEGIQYYHLHSIDLSDNLLELMTWALTIYAFYCATKGSKIAWIVTGVFAGLAVMTKYYSGFLLLSLAIFLLTDKTARLQLKEIYPYCGLIIFLIIILPHIYWLTTHDFITIKYMLRRTEGIASWRDHLLFPSSFLYEQFLIFLPTVIIYVFLLFASIDSNEEAKPCSYFDKKFLFYAAFLPFLLTLALSFLLGLKLHAGWGSPLMSLWPLCLFIFIKPPALSLKRAVLFTVVIIFLVTILGYFYFNSLSQANTKTSANFAGKSLAEKITTMWHEQYNTKLTFVAGDRFLAGSLAYYSKDHPSVWIDWNQQISPWIDIKRVEREGAVFIYYAGNDLPNSVQQSFPQTSKPLTIKLPWLRTKYSVPAENINVVFIPPQSI